MDQNIANIRREYGQLVLSIEQANTDPFLQFEQWLNDAIACEVADPTAMVLATVDAQGMPDARVVLLKEVQNQQFIFFTHYKSVKGRQLLAHPVAALNFYWSSLARQVRIRGKVSQTSHACSDAYFSSRPRSSQMSGSISPQSQVITGRGELEQRLANFAKTHGEGKLTRPKDWGGYAVSPIEFEFWQGRDNRLHDRLRYRWQENAWHIEILAP